MEHKDTFDLEDDRLPLLPPDTYGLRYISHKTSLYNGTQPKLEISFLVTWPQEFSGAVVTRYYNVKRLRGASGEKGGFVPGFRGDFLIEYLSLFGGDFGRLDRMPMSVFRNKTIVGEVITVTEARGRKRPEPLHYSKVAKLLYIDSDGVFQ